VDGKGDRSVLFNRAREIITGSEFAEDARVIVFVPAVKHVFDMQTSFELEKVAVCCFTAEMTDDEKRRSADMWMSGQVKVMIATKAFGVGIDFPSVRLCLMVGFPWCFEDAVQMAGRSGRDGLPSRALLLYDHCLEKKKEFASAHNSAAVSEHRALVRYAEASTCRRDLEIGYGFEVRSLQG
jgi:superfamily II DNA helicase RecQ